MKMSAFNKQSKPSSSAIRTFLDRISLELRIKFFNSIWTRISSDLLQFERADIVSFLSTVQSSSQARIDHSSSQENRGFHELSHANLLSNSLWRRFYMNRSRGWTLDILPDLEWHARQRSCRDQRGRFSKLTDSFENDHSWPGYGNILYSANEVKVEGMAFIIAVHSTLKAAYFRVDPRDTLEAAGKAFYRARYKTDGRRWSCGELAMESTGLRPKKKQRRPTGDGASTERQTPTEEASEERHYSGHSLTEVDR